MVLKHEKTTLKWWIFQSRLTDTRQTIKAIAGAARCCPFFLHKTYIANVQSNLISIRFIFGARFWRSKIPPFEFASSLSVCIIIFFFCIYIYVLFCYSILIHRLWHGHGKELFLHVFFSFSLFFAFAHCAVVNARFFSSSECFFSCSLLFITHWSIYASCFHHCFARTPNTMGDDDRLFFTARTIIVPCARANVILVYCVFAYVDSCILVSVRWLWN